MHGINKTLIILLLLPALSFSQCICLEDVAGELTCNPAANCGAGTKAACEGGGGIWFTAPNALDDCQATLPVPVELINFTASLDNDEVKLEWATASETNNDRFELYRSDDGIDWELLTIVLGAGNSSNVLRYNIYDMIPYFGVSYYRLKQIDFDGTFEYSRTVTISNYQYVNARLYPNPSNGKFSLEIQEELIEDFLVVLKDQTGREVYSKVIVKDYSSQIVVFDVKNKISSGMYYVTGTNNRQLFNKTILVI